MKEPNYSSYFSLDRRVRKRAAAISFGDSVKCTHTHERSKFCPWKESSPSEQFLHNKEAIINHRNVGSASARAEYDRGGEICHLNQQDGPTGRPQLDLGPEERSSCSFHRRGMFMHVRVGSYACTRSFHFLSTERLPVVSHLSPFHRPTSSSQRATLWFAQQKKKRTHG